LAESSFNVDADESDLSIIKTYETLLPLPNLIGSGDHHSVTFRMHLILTFNSKWEALNLILYVFHAGNNIQIRFIPTYCIVYAIYKALQHVLVNILYIAIFKEYT